MAGHALLSPSGFKALMLCPAKPAMERGLPDKSSDYADEGTAAHELAAMALTEGKPAANYIGTVIDVDGNEFIVDQEMADFVQVYLDLVHDLKGDGELFVEQSLPIGHITGEEGAEGTADAVIIRGNEIIVVDLKYGRGVEVDAFENPQPMLYGLGALEKFDLVGDLEHVRMVISQPRITRAPSEWALPVPALTQWGLDTAGAAAQTAMDIYNGDPEMVFASCRPHEDACRFCLAKPCAAMDRAISATLESEFTDLTTEDKVEREEIIKQLTGSISVEQLGAKMAAVELVEQWCKAIRARVEKELLGGKPVEGFKLVQGKKGNRAWGDLQEVEALLKSMRLKKAEMYDFSLISPTTAEKVLKGSPKRWTKVLPLIKQTEGKPSVAPVSDKRPALELQLESEFEVISDGVEDLV